MTNPSDPVNISAQLVKELRERTGAGFSDCRSALVEAKGNIEGAIDVLRKKGQAAAQKKAARQASEGLVGHYIHAHEIVTALENLAFAGGAAVWGGAGFGVAPPGLVMLGGDAGGSMDFGGTTGMTGCFSPGNRVMCPWPSFFSSCRISSYLPSLVVSVWSASRRIFGRMNTRRFFF